MDKMNVELWLGSSWSLFRMTRKEEFLVFSECEDNEKSRIADNDRTLSSQKRKVTIVKDQGLGISIKGGSDNKLPIIISKIFKGSAAENTGKLYVGDSILTVNGESLASLTHKQAVECITNASSPTILEVKYIPEINQDFWSKYNLEKIQWRNFYGGKRDAMNSDEKYMSIKMCLITRNLLDHSMQRVVQVYSPDLTHCLKIRCCDVEKAHDLYNYLHHVTQAINRGMLVTINNQLLQDGVPLVVRHFGWVKRSISSNKTSKRLFMLLSDVDIMTYDTVPTTSIHWNQPCSRHALIHSRLSSSEKKILPPHHTKKYDDNDANSSTQEKTSMVGKNSNRISNEKHFTQYVFNLRLASQQGISRHVYEVENNASLTAWSSALFQGVKQATFNLRHYPTHVWYKNKEYVLSLNLDKGISLSYDNRVKSHKKNANDQNKNEEKITQNNVKDTDESNEDLKRDTKEEKYITKNKIDDDYIRKCSQEDFKTVNSGEKDIGEVDDVVWRRGFEKLKSSKDDAVRFLWLSFYKEKEDNVDDDDQICFKFDLRTNPKPFVFALHSFTQALLFKQSM